ncbi:GNAT family N-acetyltransferase [Algoriphagus sp.]|uniref:GNAT family N-acetyltransferase n=1 Tax=Algoriphagus sp. TaxID=1872435 RepID=UPI00261A5335|nr:GNAT family N-acetyltransferase [Algoriphagus sp.]
MKKITIVPAEINDLPDVLSLARTAFIQAFTSGNKPENVQHYLNEAFTLTQLKKEFEIPSSHFFLAKGEDQLLGYLKVNETPSQTDIQDPESLEIARLYVLEDYLGRGVGPALLNFAMELARQKAKNYLWLGVWEKNARAIRFYEKNGLRIFGSHPFPFGDEVQTDYLMRIDF